MHFNKFIPRFRSQYLSNQLLDLRYEDCKLIRLSVRMQKIYYITMCYGALKYRINIVRERLIRDSIKNNDSLSANHMPNI